MAILKRLLGVLLALTLLGAPALAQDATINFADVHQQIFGFGAADAFLDSPALSNANADLFFSPTAGIGLSILRMGIATDGTTMSNYTNPQKASVRGARIIAVPWSAAGAQKDNGTSTNGGHLLSANYNAWATSMAGFQALLQSNAGVNLYAIGVQNEPDFTATYDSMLYTNAEMTAFVKVLGPKVAALTPRPLLLLGEVSDAHLESGFTNDTLGDATAAPMVDGIATHQYGGVVAPTVTSRPYWQTEFSYFTTFDASMGQALTTAADIHAGLTTGNVSAWIWWWILRTSQADNEGLNDTSSTTKRLYVLGNYSKFIRPGSFRVGVSGGPSGVSVSAFKSAGADQVEIVAINTSGSSTSLTCDLSGLIPATVTPWVTSSSQNLVALSPITVTAGSFTATIANNTVTTFVGTLAPPARMRKFRIR